jgi:hypothetical protein
VLDKFFKLGFKAMAFNLAVGFFMVWAVASYIRDRLFPALPTPCSERMDHSVSLGLSHNGRILQAHDFQAMSNNQDFGVIDNLAIVPARNAPAPIVMDILLKSGTAQQGSPQVEGGGISLPWTPRVLQANLTHACIAYSVFFPETFDFSEAGTLPGLRGASKALNAMNDEKFVARMVWGLNGAAQHHVHAGDNEVNHRATTGGMPRPVSFPKGRWVRLEQEVKLNDLGYSNGLSRMWVDGKFLSERKDVILRFAKDSFINGAVIDVFFGGQGDDVQRGRATKDERIMITPIEIRWQ